MFLETPNGKIRNLPCDVFIKELQAIFDKYTNKEEIIHKIVEFVK